MDAVLKLIIIFITKLTEQKKNKHISFENVIFITLNGRAMNWG